MTMLIARVGLCVALVMAGLLGLASPAAACDLIPDARFQLEGDDLVDLDDPDGPLARSYAAWLAETEVAEPESTPPTVLGVTLREIVAVVPETDTKSLATVTATVGIWGDPLLFETATDGPLELGSLPPGSCESYPSGDLGDRHLIINTDRGPEWLGASDSAVDNLDQAFGAMTPVDLDQAEIDGFVDEIDGGSPLTIVFTLVVALGLLVAVAMVVRRLVLSGR